MHIWNKASDEVKKLVLGPGEVELKENLIISEKQELEILPNTLIPKYLKDLGVKIQTDFDKALQWCDVVNMLRLQNERMSDSFFPSVREYKKYYGLNMDRLQKVNKDIVIMHPGPINRGVEITSEVADSNNSIILDQVENGVAIRMAVIYLLAKKNFDR